MTSLHPPLLDTDVLPLAELFALCLDGQLFRVGDAFATIDTPDGPELRAAAFARSAPRRTVADRGSAAWIHGTRAMPPPLPQVCVPADRRGRLSRAVADASHRALDPAEVMTIGPSAVTTPSRTALDLLSSPGRFGAEQALEVRHLLALAGTSPERFARALVGRSRKGCGLARNRMPAVERARLPGGVRVGGGVPGGVVPGGGAMRG